MLIGNPIAPKGVGCDSNEELLLLPGMAASDHWRCVPVHPVPDVPIHYVSSLHCVPVLAGVTASPSKEGSPASEQRKIIFQRLVTPSQGCRLQHCLYSSKRLLLCQ
jgi:hypothetical protein